MVKLYSSQLLIRVVVILAHQLYHLLMFPMVTTAPDSSTVVVTVEGGSVVSAVLKLKSDVHGNLNGLFRIPDTDTLKFRTGTRIFRLCDDSLNRKSVITTFGDANFSASGVIETRQNTITSVSTSEIVRNTVSENRVVNSVVSSSSDIIYDNPDPKTIVDPLAETFVCGLKGGAFITSVDLYFATKDPTIPVEVQIRSTVNGYPGQTILPFGRVILNPASVIVDPDGTRNLATRFTFDSPVYLQENNEYAIVILSNSNNYNVWVARLGEDQVGTTNQISSQPYTGSFFLSQNASTWSAEQMEDLKFIINRAEFNTAVTADLKFVNETLGVSTLSSSCFYTVNGSKVVRVYHPGHGIAFRN